MAIDTLGANALASDSVTTAKIVNDAVTSAKIPAGAVVAADVADGSISTAKLADDAVTSAKLDTNITIGGTLGVTGLITASGSVAVGGTGSANTLDDFEEGTFDVKLRNYNTNTDTAAKTCRYVKVGAMVMIMFPDGGTGSNSAYFYDDTNSGSGGAVNHRFDVTTSTGFNALPFLPKGTGQSGVAWTRGLRSADDDSTGGQNFGVGWRGGVAQIHLGRITTDGAEYGIYDGVNSDDTNVYLEKDSTVTHVVFNCSFVYYTDA